MREIKVLKEMIEAAETLHRSCVDMLDRAERSKQQKENKAA